MTFLGGYSNGRNRSAARLEAGAVAKPQAQDDLRQPPGLAGECRGGHFGGQDRCQAALRGVCSPARALHRGQRARATRHRSGSWAAARSTPRAGRAGCVLWARSGPAPGSPRPATRPQPGPDDLLDYPAHVGRVVTEPR
jgi:hypothetical protein